MALDPGPSPSEPWTRAEFRLPKETSEDVQIVLEECLKPKRWFPGTAGITRAASNALPAIIFWTKPTSTMVRMGTSIAELATRSWTLWTTIKRPDPW